MKEFTHICKGCGNEFVTNHYQSAWCEECKKPKLCKCGCGKYVKSREYALGCKSRGKTYKEIYGVDRPNCGFKPGDENVAKRIDVRAKISESVKKSYTPELRLKRSESTARGISSMNIFKFKYENDRGEKFRSILEMNFSQLLYDNNIEYTREVPFKMKNNKYKIIDFVIDDILIEITGFAHKSWQDNFIEKITNLWLTSDHIILILTYPIHVDRLRQNLSNLDMNLWIESIYDINRILAKIKFCKMLVNCNKFVDEHYYQNQLIK